MSDTILIDTETQKIKLYNDGNFKCSGYGLVDLVKYKHMPIGLEIGCDVGDTAVRLLTLVPNLVLHSIDPYTDYIDWNGNDLSSRENTYNTAMNRLNVFGNSFILHRKTSDDAVCDFDDAMFDFIFIDGLHTYEQLTKDCHNYYPKLKTGGVFSGHDYTAIQGVNKAATEFANKMEKQISLTEVDVWYWVK